VTLILDGPMGTELVRRGVPAPLPSWSAHALDVAPDVVAAIHSEYAAAGAEVHTANTFRVRKRSVGERWPAMLNLAVRIAKKSALPGQRVAGSIGPLEDCYRPDLSPGEASRADHAELARALMEAGVDLLLCETFSHGAEAAVAVREAVRTGVETWVALTAGPDATLMTPRAMGEVARACAAEGARVVLVNCTPAKQTLSYVEAIATAGVAVGAYANAGSATDGMGWQSQAPALGSEGVARYADFARTWLEAGASVIGGCCGTGPAHIRGLARL
jgi:homocysteine S-methyltransferase